MVEIKENIRGKSQFKKDLASTFKAERTTLRGSSLLTAISLLMSITTSGFNGSRNFGRIARSCDSMFVPTASMCPRKIRPFEKATALLMAFVPAMHSSKATFVSTSMPLSKIRPLPNVKCFLEPTLDKVASVIGISDDEIRNSLVFGIASGNIKTEEEAANSYGTTGRKGFLSLNAAKDAIEPSVDLKKRYIFKQAVIAGRPYISNTAIDAAVGATSYVPAGSFVSRIVRNTTQAAVDAAIRVAILNKVIDDSDTNRDIAIKTRDIALDGFNAAIARANEAISKIPVDYNNPIIAAARAAIAKIPTTIDDADTRGFITDTNAAFEKALTAAQEELYETAIIAALNAYNTPNNHPRVIDVLIYNIAQYKARDSVIASMNEAAIHAAFDDLISASRDATRATVDAAIARDVARDDQVLGHVYNYYNTTPVLPDPVTTTRNSAATSVAVLDATAAASDARARAARAYAAFINALSDLVDNYDKSDIYSANYDLALALSAIFSEAETAYSAVRSAHTAAIKAYDSSTDTDNAE